MEPARGRDRTGRGPGPGPAVTDRRETPLDAARIVRVLGSHEVDYVMIGGLAVQAHGHLRTTQDADVLPASGHLNLERLLAALRELDAHPLGTAPDRSGALEMDVLEGRDPLALDSDAGGIDVHRAPPGAPPYAQLRDRALALDIFGVQVRFADRDDLIAMKRAARRPLDLGDIAALTADED